MPGQMQKKAKASLSESGASTEKVDHRKALEVTRIAEDDSRYQETLSLLRYGGSPAKIADKLVKNGTFSSRKDALLMAERVSKENPGEQRTNALILIGTALFFGIIGLIFVAPPIIENGFSELLQPPSFVFLLSGWFIYKGIRTWLNTSE